MTQTSKRRKPKQAARDPQIEEARQQARAIQTVLRAERRTADLARALKRTIRMRDGTLRALAVELEPYYDEARGVERPREAARG